MGKSKRAPAVQTAPKKQRTEQERPKLHKQQLKLAKLAFKTFYEEHEQIVLALATGAGKPRVLGAFLGQLKEAGWKGLVIYVPLTAAKAKEEHAMVGSNFQVHFNGNHIGGLHKALEDDGYACTMIPITTFRKMMPYGKSAPISLTDLLDMLKAPRVLIWFDEVHQIYVKPNDKLLTALPFKKYKVTVGGMSGTDRLDDAGCCARATLLFNGEEPTPVALSDASEEELRNDINPQRKVCERKKMSKDLPMFEEGDALAKVTTLAKGRELFPANTAADGALKVLLGELLAQQVLGDDGGELFKVVPTSNQVPMTIVQGDVEDHTKWGDTTGYETWLVACSLPSCTERLLEGLKQLKGTEGVRPFTVHDLRMEARIEAAKAIKLHKRDDNDMKAALNAYFADTKAQKGLNIGFIDKHQAIGTNDFAKNVHRTIAIGDWAPHELAQFFDRLVRACVLAPGDLVAKEVWGVHLASPFLTTMLTAKFQRNLAGATLSEEVKTNLAKLKGDLGEADQEARDKYRAVEDSAKYLATTQLKEAAEGFLECTKGEFEQEAFKITYEEIFTHHEDCEKDDEGKKVIACCDKCTSVFRKFPTDEED